MADNPHEKMVSSAIALIAEKGLADTSFADVIAHSGAPRGSIYHHFPQGKRQLAEAAVRETAERVLAYLRVYEGRDLLEALDRFIALWRRVVIASDAKSGCAIAGAALSSGDDERDVMPAVREAFRAWRSALSDQFERCGLSKDRCNAFASLVLAAMEGALILCRAEADVGPLDAVATMLRATAKAEFKP